MYFYLNFFLMNEEILLILSFVLLIIGILGTFLPVLPGLIFSFGGLLLYKLGTTNDLPMMYIWIFGALTFISGILEYVIPAKFTKKHGGTRWGSIGSILGTIIGFFYIPMVFGFLIGMLLGAFVGELLHDSNDKKKAFNATKGAFIGFIMGTGFNLIVGLAMFLIVLYYQVF